MSLKKLMMNKRPKWGFLMDGERNLIMKKLIFAFICSLFMLSCNPGTVKQDVPVKDSIECIDTTFVGDSILTDSIDPGCVLDSIVEE